MSQLTAAVDITSPLLVAACLGRLEAAEKLMGLLVDNKISQPFSQNTWLSGTAEA
jgi:hypothetical protein